MLCCICNHGRGSLQVCRGDVQRPAAENRNQDIRVRTSLLFHVVCAGNVATAGKIYPWYEYKQQYSLHFIRVLVSNRIAVRVNWVGTTVHTWCYCMYFRIASVAVRKTGEYPPKIRPNNEGIVFRQRFKKVKFRVIQAIWHKTMAFNYLIVSTLDSNQMHTWYVPVEHTRLIRTFVFCCKWVYCCAHIYTFHALPLCPEI